MLHGTNVRLKRVLKDAGLKDQYDIVSDWYEGYDNLIKYGMSFKGKKCRIALVK